MVRYKEKHLGTSLPALSRCSYQSGGENTYYKTITTDCRGRSKRHILDERRSSFDGTVFIRLTEPVYFQTTIYKTGLFALKNGDSTTGELRAQFAGDSHMSPVPIIVTASEEGDRFVLTYLYQNETMRRITRVEYSNPELARGLRMGLRSVDTVIEKRPDGEKELFSIEWTRVGPPRKIK